MTNGPRITLFTTNVYGLTETCLLCFFLFFYLHSPFEMCSTMATLKMRARLQHVLCWERPQPKHQFCSERSVATGTHEPKQRLGNTTVWPLAQNDCRLFHMLYLKTIITCKFCSILASPEDSRRRRYISKLLLRAENKSTSRAPVHMSTSRRA